MDEKIIKNTAEDIFFKSSDLDQQTVFSVIGDALSAADDGELYMEYVASEGISFSNGKVENSSFNQVSGFGLRSVCGENSLYAHNSDFSLKSLKKAAQVVQQGSKGYKGIFALPETDVITRLYDCKSPIDVASFEKKIKIFTEMDAYTRQLDSKISQVNFGLSSAWKVVGIFKPGHPVMYDIRPYLRMGIMLTVQNNGKTETGMYGFGSRENFDQFFTTSHWEYSIDKALRQALIKLEAHEAPSGDLPVVLGTGFVAALLHEAVGHGLEGDFNRKGSSAYSGKIGQQVASKGVTIYDDGTIPGRPGSLSFDDEGTKTNKTVLIEDGILKGYMQDRLNARLMKAPLTGNGRRESYAHVPMPRMTNTYMANGKYTPEEIIKSVKKGVYVVDVTGGQVEISSGDFNFSASESYLIENGQITTPLKGVTLIGNGPDIMRKVTMIGNDMALDKGTGTCGKDGQGVSVGVGEPTMLISSLVVGGSKAP